MALTIEWTADAARFSELEPQWEPLAERSRSPCLRHAWFRAWWRAFGGSSRLALCLAWDGEDLAAAFPLRQVGRRLEGLAGSTAPTFAPIARDAAARDAVVAAAARSAAGEIVLRSVPAGASQPVVVQARSAGRLVDREPMHRAPLVDTRGSFDEYLAGRDAGFRRNLERRRRKLEREHEVETSVWARPRDPAAELQESLDLEAAGWKGADGGAILCSPERTAFYRSLAVEFDRDGRFVLAGIRVDGRLAATAICLLDFDRLWMLKSAFDESLRPYSLGLQLNLRCVERCFAEQLEACELLGDSSDWKRSLATGETPHEAIRLYRHRPLPLGRRAFRRTIAPPLRRLYWLLRRERVARLRNR